MGALTEPLPHPIRMDQIPIRRRRSRGEHDIQASRPLDRGPAPAQRATRCSGEDALPLEQGATPNMKAIDERSRWSLRRNNAINSDWAPRDGSEPTHTLRAPIPGRV